MVGVGKSNAKMYVEKQTGVTFKDVAGQDEAKESLQEVVDFLHNPGKYTGIGAKLPKGALLVGPPGTGKTLACKSGSGEKQKYHFSIVWFGICRDVTSGSVHRECEICSSRHSRWLHVSFLLMRLMQ